MDIVLVVQSLIGLIVFLGILIFLLLYNPKKKSAKQKAPVEDVKYRSFESLSNVIRNRKATTEELDLAVEEILENYADITPKVGANLHEDFYKYSELIIRLARHPYTTKDVLLKLERGLVEYNPQYKKDLSDALTQGIKAR